MAQEATIVELMGWPKGMGISYSVEDNAAVEKGTLMQISGSAVKYARASYVSGAKFAGIAASEKVANDGQVKLGLYTCGIFDLWSSDTIAEGDAVSLSGSNWIRNGVGTGKNPFGVALEASAAGTAEQIQVAVGIYGVSGN